MKQTASASLQTVCLLYFQRINGEFETLDSLSGKLRIPQVILEPVLSQLVALGIVWGVRWTNKKTLYAYRPPKIQTIILHGPA